MFARIHNKLGTAGLVVAIVALVAALAGTAIAASGLNRQQKKEVKKIAKKFAGKRGPVGAAGPVGPQGQAGAPGKDGTNGTNGTNGTDGTNGKSVTTGSEATGTGNCEGRGGVWVEVEGSGTKRYVCNGAGGSAGGGTQTGVWSFESDSPFHMVMISYPERLEAGPNFKWVGPGQTVAGCPGTPADPQADAGNFCMYAEELVSADPPSGWNSYTTDKTSGSVVEFAVASGELGYGYGSWAVTPATP